MVDKYLDLDELKPVLDNFRKEHPNKIREELRYNVEDYHKISSQNILILSEARSQTDDKFNEFEGVRHHFSRLLFFLRDLGYSGEIFSKWDINFPFLDGSKYGILIYGKGKTPEEWKALRLVGEPIKIHFLNFEDFINCLTKQMDENPDLLNIMITYRNYTLGDNSYRDIVIWAKNPVVTSVGNDPTMIKMIDLSVKFGEKGFRGVMISEPIGNTGKSRYGILIYGKMLGSDDSDWRAREAPDSYNNPNSLIYREVKT